MEKQINILDVNILNTSYEEITAIIKNKIDIREKFSFHNVNVSILLKYCRDDIFKKSLNSFTSLLSDGIGVYWASKIKKKKNGLKIRITGTDLYYRILKLADENNLKCFFFGGSKEAVKLLPDTLKKKFPDINISGMLPREINLGKETIEKIKNSKADILFVGLGSPHQEDWIAEFGNSLDIPIQIAIGSGIEFISGAKKRDPNIFQKLGLEWLYRIYLEPGRLWKRYVFGIPIFMFKIIIFKFKLIANKQKN
ncbi:MAG: WecB/TagA/CpsF family glycosyltransferase [Ignavibacteriae bacterium]|nr:WecB/TagA/CpsF family glycosyltransferase [Ignavibacteriota bacterium]